MKRLLTLLFLAIVSSCGDELAKSMTSVRYISPMKWGRFTYSGSFAQKKEGGEVKTGPLVIFRSDGTKVGENREVYLDSSNGETVQIVYGSTYKIDGRRLVVVVDNRTGDKQEIAGVEFNPGNIGDPEIFREILDRTSLGGATLAEKPLEEEK